MAYATPMVAIHGIVAIHMVATRAITLYLLLLVQLTEATGT